MTHLGIIGGSGLTALAGLRVLRRQMQQTPWGEPSGPLVVGEFAGREVIFLPRHGQPHAIPPHKINYRANIWALHEVGVRRVVAVNAVGGIAAQLGPGALVIPDQIIDYTWSRPHTYFESDLDRVIHIDFTAPYSAALRELLLVAAAQLKLAVHPSGTDDHHFRRQPFYPRRKRRHLDHPRAPRQRKPPPGRHRLRPP